MFCVFSKKIRNKRTHLRANICCVPMWNWKQNGEILLLYIGYLGWKALIPKVTSLMKSRQFYNLVASTVGTTPEKQGSNYHLQGKHVQSTFIRLCDPSGWEVSCCGPVTEHMSGDLSSITLHSSEGISTECDALHAIWAWIRFTRRNGPLHAKGASGSAPIQIDFHPAEKKKQEKKKAWEIGALWRLCLSHNLQNSAANWHFLKQPRRLVVEVLRPFDPATAADLSSSSAASISRERGSDRPASSRREYLLTPLVANFHTTVLALWHLDEKRRLIALKTRRGIQLEPPHR